LTFRAAVFAKIAAAGFTVPVAYPGVTFTPPDKGNWLEVALFENEPVEPGVGYVSHVFPRGILQITACGRNGKGMVGLESLANQIQTAFPRGLVLQDDVRVTRAPWRMGDITDNDKVMIPVSISYSG
jgi:hypothetical protein